jgi:type II secretory pathway pseudopilin PulG
MKTTTSDKWQVTGLRLATARQASDKIKGAPRDVGSCHLSHVTCHISAFTLIELLIIIAIMGGLAALIVPVAGAVKRTQSLNTARAEMARLETAIDRYKSTYGFYPPDNQVQADLISKRFRVPQLYYELTGTTNANASNPTYQSLHDPTIPVLTGADVNAIFGVGGFINCSKPGGGEDAGLARGFLPDLNPKQIWNNYTNHFPSAEPGVTLLVTSVGGPDPTYAPLEPGLPGVNPWRYNSSNPTNNPGSYDLWIQLSIGSTFTNGVVSTPKYYLICNWSKQAQINSPLP